MPDYLGFQYRGILDIYRLLFYAVVVVGPKHDFLFKSAATYYVPGGDTSCLLYLLRTLGMDDP